MVELDGRALKLELKQRNESPQSGWEEMTLAAPRTRPCLVSLVWDQQRLPVVPRRGVAAGRLFSSAASSKSASTTGALLYLAVSRLEKDSGPSRLQIKIKGRGR